MAKTDVGSREWYIAVIGPTMLLVGRIQKTLGCWTRKKNLDALSVIKSHPSRSTEDNAEGYLH